MVYSINIGNTASNSFGTPEQQTFEFDVTEQGAYSIAVYSAASEWSDCIIGQLSLTANSYNDTGIMTVKQAASGKDQYYDLQGRKVTVTNQSAPALRKGIYIKNGKKYYLSPLK